MSNRRPIGHRSAEICTFMNLYVSTMDATVVAVETDGRVQLLDEDWHAPTLQERRAIIHAAREEIAALSELIDILERDAAARLT